MLTCLANCQLHSFPRTREASAYTNPGFRQDEFFTPMFRQKLIEVGHA